MDIDGWQETSEGQEDTNIVADEFADWDSQGETDLNLSYAQGKREMDMLGLMDIGNLATWYASSSKQGCGVDQLRNEGPMTYWQSDGPQPHDIDIHFAKRVSIERISIFCDSRYDESYTPQKIIIHAGTGLHDLQQVSVIELQNPKGWSHLSFSEIHQDGVIKTFLLRITVVTNHQNGKDTHIRAIKLYSPAPARKFDDSEVGFNSIVMLSETMIR